MSRIIDTSLTRYGRMSYFRGDLIGRSLAEYGEWAQKELDFLRKYIKAGDTIIDVGAFIGTHSIAFSSFVGPTGRVLAFEPNPLAFELLALNDAQNHINNIETYQYGISDHLFVSSVVAPNKDNLGSFALGSEIPGLEVADGTNSVYVKPLDSLINVSPRLVKIDVEGHELNVLKGALKIILTHRPLLFVECLSAHQGWEVIDFLRQYHYKPYLLLSEAFNEDNFLENSQNFFGLAKEAGLFFAADDSIEEILDAVPITSIDDLVLGMLYKPQYKYEVLGDTTASLKFGNKFWLNQNEVLNLTHEHTEVIASLNLNYEQKLSQVKQESEERLSQVKQESEERLSQVKQESEERLSQVKQESEERLLAILHSVPYRLGAKLHALVLRFIPHKVLRILKDLAILIMFNLRVGSIRTLFSHKYFDAEWYAQDNPDVREAKIPSLLHYLRFGWREGRKPVPNFDPIWYLETYSDVRMSGLEPYTHYLMRGKREGRLSSAQSKNTDYSTDGLVKFRLVYKYFTARRLQKAVSLLVRGDWRMLFQKIQALRRVTPELKYAVEQQPHIFELEQLVDKTSPNVEKIQVASVLPIDIIVPVYNGFELLGPLFSSLLGNTNAPFNLIIVDDCSTDARIDPFLCEIARRNKNVRVLRSPKNIGFVKAINLGAKYAQNHFVILNTDVELPPGWLSRLIEPILNENKVASTTPFTNSGTICSFPIFIADNPLAYGLDLSRIDAAFQNIDAQKNLIELPTGVGFCMGINRDAWKEVGEFNEKIFGRGYGEENDWCRRAFKAGYKNVIAPNLFVYHKHGGTFPSEEKQALITSNLKKLHSLHPEYADAVDEFIKRDPLAEIREFVSALLLMKSADSVSLLFDHALGGGTNLYTQQLIQEEIGKGKAVVQVAWEPSLGFFSLAVIGGKEKVRFKFNTLDILCELRRFIAFDEVLCNNIVSYPNVLEATRAIVDVVNINQSKLYVAIHDFFALCPSYTLLDYKGVFCGLPSVDVCSKCLPRNMNKPSGEVDNIVHWRDAWSILMRRADRILTFSQSSAELLARVYPEVIKKIVVRPHAPLTNLRPVQITPGPLNIGVVGNINKQKGWQLILEMAEILEVVAPEARITIIGKTETVPTVGNIRVVGGYAQEALADIVEEHGINLAFFSSIWPETFSYVVTELMQMRLPIVAFNLGAQAERLRHYPLVRILDVIDPRNTVSEILDFYSKEAFYAS